jgi:hypothetical protein
VHIDEINDFQNMIERGDDLRNEDFKIEEPEPNQDFTAIIMKTAEEFANNLFPDDNISSEKI